MRTKFYKLDVTAFLETPEQREAYLAAARELGDPELLEKAERTVARAAELYGGHAAERDEWDDVEPNDATLAAIEEGNAILDSSDPGRFGNGADLIAAALGDDMAERCPYCGGELVTSWDPIPPEDGEDEELAELYAAGVEHTVCSCCGFVGFAPEQVRELQMQLD